MTQLKFAAVDLGAESGRVVVGLFDGEKLELKEAHRFPNVPVRVHDTLHWDILRLWNDILDGLSKAVSTYGADICGVGVDTWGVDFGLLDANDNLLGNPVHYRDRRNDGMMEHVFQTVPRADIFDSTGLQFIQFNTLFQLAALKAQNSPQLNVAKTLLMTPDLLNFWLCGRKAGEYTIASTSQMLNAKTREWDVDLLGRLDLPANILPELVSPGETLGLARAEVCERTGLSRSTPIVAPGSHDTASAVAAVPADGENWAYLSSGTWSLMGVERKQPLINAQVAQWNFTNEGGVDGTIRFLKNIAGLWLVQECRRTWAREGTEYSYDDLTQRAAGGNPLVRFIEPDHADFVAPADMPLAIRNFCERTNQDPPSSVAGHIRCCLESLALKYRRTLERLETLNDCKIETLHIVGGGAQNGLLSRLTADCLGRRVVVGPIEATATGNILTQMMAHGEVKNLGEMREIVRRSFSPEVFEPNPQTAGAWDEAYQRYLTIAE